MNAMVFASTDQRSWWRVMSIKYRPFVGEAYQGRKTRLLVLGQSHHGSPDEADEHDMTSRVIREHLAGAKRIPFFTKLHHVLGLNDDVQEREVFEKISFYNFVQDLLEIARKVPTRAEWESGTKPFLEVVKQLDPTHILVLGKATYRELPRFDEALGQIKFGPNPTEEVGRYSTPSGSAITIGIPHPSSPGFSPAVWAEPVKAFLEDNFLPR